jgi:hypothetical protein
VDKNKFLRSKSYTRKDGNKIPTYYCRTPKKKKDVHFHFKERLRMMDKMETKDSKKAYGLRKMTVEPAYGNLKTNLGFGEFLLRGIENLKIEFNLACISNNLQKIFNLRAFKGC